MAKGNGEQTCELVALFNLTQRKEYKEAETFPPGSGGGGEQPAEDIMFK